jgi:AcrR family transcriptional regulator
VTTGLRERKKLATRLALHQAALELVAERGLDAVSVDDIAARADVSPRTFFNYFPSKDDAVLGLDPATPQRLAEAFSGRPESESPMQALHAVLLERAAKMAEEPELWPLRIQVIESHPVLLARLMADFAESERALSAAIAERTGTQVGAHVYPALLAAVQSAVMRASLSRWRASNFTVSLPDVVDESWAWLSAGLPAPPQ